MRKFYFLLILVLFAGVSNAQLSGTKTIPGDYATIDAAVTDLNAVGVGTGGVTFNVLAGHTESTTAPITITATGSSANTIVFQKSGSGANPIVTRTDAGSLTPTALGAQADAVVIIQGADYVTFDGIDVTATNAAAGIEYGYYLRKASVTDGCKNVTIKNAAITMVKSTSAYVVGIYSSNNDPSSLVSSATGITVTSTGGRNENVSFTGNTISGVFSGIVLRGFNHTTAPNDFQDQSYVVTGNTIQNYAGNAASSSYGVYLIYHTSPTISNNTISNAGGGGVNATSTLYGIFNSSSNAGGNVVVNNNNITLSQGSTSGAQCIYISPTCTSVTVNSNTFNLPVFASTSASYLIYCSNSTPNITVNGNATSGAISKTGVGTFICYYNNGSPTSGLVTITNNNFSNITLTGTSLFTGIQQTTSTTQVAKIQNNTINSITGGTSPVYGVYFNYGATACEISGNVVSSMTGGGNNYGLWVGTTASTSLSVFGNRFNSLTTTGASTVAGYLHSSGTNSSIYQNKIYDIVANNASGIAYGMQVNGGASVNVYNNLIGDIRTPISNAAIPLVGINVSGGTAVNLYYNTIYLNASSSGATFGSAALYASTAVNLVLNNNIFVNSSTPAGATGFTAAYRRTTTTLTTYSSTSNNNCFYAGTPGANNVIFYDGTNSDQTLAAYKSRVSARDAASVAENVSFLSTVGSSVDFLHIDPAVPTQLESGATPIAGITTDYDGITRSASLPDIGADEGVYTLLDVNPPSISYSPLTFTCDGNARTLTTTISDASGVPTSGTGLPVLYWKINSGTYSAVTATFVSGSTYTFSFGAGAALGDVVSYFIVAQDNAGTPNVGAAPATGAAGFTANPPVAATPPSTPSSYTINGTLNGIYTVGATGTYPTLTAALADYTAKCLTGPVTFSLIDPLYSTSETFPLTINVHPDASATNTLTIRPAAGVTTSITGSVASNGLIRVLGSHVIIDGSNDGTGFQNLSIQNTNTTGPRVILAGSATATPLVNVTLKNFYALNGSKTSTSAVAIQIANSGGTAGNFNNILVENISVSTSYIGIYAIANVASGNGSALIIRNNGLDVSGPTSLNYVGVYVQGTDGALITGNRIGNFDGTTGQMDMGIWLATGTVNTLIEKNSIGNLVYTGTGGYAGRGITLSTAVTGSNNIIKNNMIYGLGGDGDDFGTFGNNYNPVGIYLYGATVQTGVEISNNSIFLSGNYINGAGTYVVGIALDDNSAASIRNNVIKNTAGILAAGTGVGPVGIAAENSIAQFTALSNNAYNIATAGTGTNNIGKVASTDYATLAAFQAATSADANSKSATVTFASATNLHLSNALGDNICLDGAATPLANVTDDFDGQPRNATTPDMGADEFSLTLPTFVTTAQSACFGQTVNLTAAGVTAGSTAGQTFTYFTDAALTTPVADATAVGAGTYYIKATYTSGGCSIDQVQTVVVTINALPNVSMVVAETSGASANDGSICAGDAATLTASGATSYTWAPGGETTAAITVNPTTTTAYTVIGTDANGCQNTASTTITVNALPVASITVAETSGTTNNDGTICAGASASLTASGGSSYSWSDGSTTAAITVSPTTTTTYTVTVTDGNGCSATSNTTITVNAIPTTYNVTGGGAYCSGGVGSSIGLSGSDASISYELYLGGSATGNIVSGTGSAISFGTITTAGTYTVVASNAATGCSVTMSGSATVSVGDVPTISYVLTQPNNCNSNNGGAALTLGGAAGPYTFNWTGAGIIQGVQDQTTLRVGAYTVVVTAANGCQATANFSLFGPGGCDICPTIGAVSTTPTAICEGGTATLSATGLADLGVSYGIDFVVSSTALANPYSGGTTVATVANGSLVPVGTLFSASATTTFNTPGNIYVYAILSPAPADPACRPFQSTQIQVNATPDVDAVANQTVCSGSATSAVTFSGTVPGTVYSWTNNNPAIGLAASGTGNISSFTGVNYSNAPVTATITVTPTNPAGPTNPCPGPSKTFTITVNPIPTVNTVSNVTACSGATISVPFSGFLAGTTYEWANSNTAIGLAASGTGNLSFTATNSGSTTITSNIVVTPKYTNNGVTCTGTPVAFTITINPTPTVNVVNNQVVCNSASTTAISFSGSTTGTVYNWTNNTPSIGLAASGSGDIASFTAVNNGTAPVTATITVTPDYTNGGSTCNGAATTFTITVNPVGQVNTVSNQTVCNGANTTAVTFATTNTGGTTTYSWTNDNTSIGLAASGTGDIASFVGVNTGTTPVTATITVTPTYINGLGVQQFSGSIAAAGPNMSARMNRFANTSTCSNITSFPGIFATGAYPYTSYTYTNTTGTTQCISSTVTGTSGNIFMAAYSNSFDPANIATNYLADAGSSSVASTPKTMSFNVPNGTTYVLVLHSVDPGQAGTYNLSISGVPVSCTGTPITFTYTVNPTPTVNAVSNEVVCNGANTTAVTFSGAVTGTTYSWTNDNTSIGLAASGTGNIASFAAVNTGTSPITATITVTPSYTNGGTTCTGTPTSYTITVNPTPTVNTVANQAVCNGSNTAAVTFSGAITGTVYNWTNNTTSIGLGASGTGDIASFVGVNTGTAPVTATITVTPSFTNGGVTCTGTPRTFTITVNPIPTVNAVSNQVVCNGSNTTTVTFSGAVTGTTYNWANDNTSIGLAASGTGNIASFAAVNTGTTPVTATITVTPSYTNGGTTCTGTPTTFTITVNPTPTVTQPANQVLCNGSNTTAVAFTGAVAGTVYNWTNNTTSIGLAASGIGNIASFAAVNSGVAPVTATITVTPSFTSGGVTCTGTPRTFTITVNPTPTVNAVSNQVVCNRSTTTAVTFTGAVTGTVYNWTNNTPSIGLAASGTGNIAAFTAVNTTQTPVVATITVTPSYTNGGVTCTGTPRTFTITVNPTPIVTATDLFNQRICISDGPVALNGTPVGGTWSGIGVSGFNFIPGTTAVGNFLLTYSYTNQYGCTSTDTTTAKVSACDERNISLNNGGAVVYPNPNGGLFNIRVNSTRFQFLQMRIYNDIGQLISTKQWSGLVYGQVLPVDMRHLPAAVYTVRIIYDGGNLYEDKGYQMLIQH